MIRSDLCEETAELTALGSETGSGRTKGWPETARRVGSRLDETREKKKNKDWRVNDGNDGKDFRRWWAKWVQWVHGPKCLLDLPLCHYVRDT